MAALSKSSILDELTKGDLVVSPLLSDNQIGPSSVDLRMGNVALVARAGKQSHVDAAAYRDPKSHPGIEAKRQKHDRFDVLFKDSFLLHPGSLVLVPTLEWIAIPSTLQGVVTARSSWAREGLNIATATIVNPRYRGIVTLELANFGQIPIQLHPGLRIAQLALYTLERRDPEKDDQPEDLDERQFNLAFEPEAGNIAKQDEPFIPA
jgi:dCTP deaminase